MSIQRKKAKRFITKLILFVVLTMMIWGINHYLQTVTIPDWIEETATRQVEDSEEVSRQMREYQILKGNVDPLTWIITLALFFAFFFSDIWSFCSSEDQSTKPESGPYNKRS